MFSENEKIMKIAKNKGFEDVVIISENNDRTQVRFANGEVTIAKNWTERKSELFVEKNKKIASLEISQYASGYIEKLMNELAGVVDKMEKKEDYFGIAEPPFKYENISDTYDSRILEVDPEDYIKKAIDATGLERVAGVLYVDHPQTYLSTSNGAEVKDEGTGIEISIRAFKEDLASGHATNSARVLSKFHPEKAGAKAGEIAKMVSEPELGETGRFDVIFDPLPMGNLLSMVGRFTSMMAVEAGFSFLVNKLGKRVASEQFTLRDIGNMPNGYGTRSFDDEGVPTKNTAIINKGVLKTYLLNHSYAKKYNMENTANSGIVMPHPWNIYVEPGNFGKDEIFDIKRGIYITNIWYTRFQNYVSGDFSTIPRDGIFLVENGEITKAIKNIRISDNIQHILENIHSVGNEVEQIHWWECNVPVNTPYIRIKDVGITRATQ